jgi:hypothetical protein
MLIIHEKQDDTKKEYYPGAKIEDGPYYDQKDIHVHRWVHGYVCGQKAHQKNIIQSKKQYAKYCTICNEIDNNIVSTKTKITSVHEIDSIPNIINVIPGPKKIDPFSSVEIIDTIEATMLKQIPAISKISDLSSKTITNILDTDLFMRYETGYNAGKIMFRME